MPKLIFEAEHPAELVAQVKRWLASLAGRRRGRHLGVPRPSPRGLSSPRTPCASSPRRPAKPVAQNDLVKALTAMGYKATDATSNALVDGLDSVETAHRRQRGASRSAIEGPRRCGR